MQHMAEAKRLSHKVHQYIPLGDVTLVSTETPNGIDVVKNKLSGHWTTAPSFTLDEWDNLPESELNDLTGKSYYVVCTPDIGNRAPTVLTFLARRCICEVNDEFIITRDQKGLSGITL